MPERVVSMPAPRPFIRPSKYNWNLLFDGSIWKLTPGLDFTNHSTMRSLVGQRAKKRGLTATVRWDGSYLYIQAHPDPRAATVSTEARAS